MNNFRGGMGMGGFGGGNLGQLMKQAQKMQADIENAKAEISATEFKGTAGGGMVECKMMGNRTVKTITINPQVVDSDDIEMLEDLVCASVNDALAQIVKAEAEKLPQMPGM